MRIAWPVWVGIGSFAGSSAFLWTLHNAWPSSPFFDYLLTYAWPLLFLAFLVERAYERLRAANPNGPASIFPTETQGFFVITLFPALLFIVDRLHAHTGVATDSVYGLIGTIVRILLIVGVVAALVFGFISRIGDERASFTGRWWAPVSLASLIIALGGPGLFGYLEWALPTQFFDVNIALRATWLVIVFGLFTLLFSLEVGHIIALDGLGIRKKLSGLREITFDPGPGLYQQFLEIQKTVGSFLANFIELSWHVIKSFFGALGKAVIRVARSFDLFSIFILASAAGLILVSLIVSSSAPSITYAILESLDSNRLDFPLLLFFAAFFGWAGVFSLVHGYLLYKEPERPIASYGVVASFSVLGLWFASLMVWLAAIFGRDGPAGYSLGGTLFLVLFGGIWALFWASSRISNPLAKIIAYSAFSLATVATLWGLSDRFWPPSGLPVYSAPTRLAPPMPIEQSTNVSPPLPATKPSSTARTDPGPSISWLDGRWGIDGECTTTIELSRDDEELEIDFAGNVERQTMTSATTESVATHGWSFTRRGTVISATASGQPLGDLIRCDS